VIGSSHLVQPACFTKWKTQAHSNKPRLWRKCESKDTEIFHLTVRMLIIKATNNDKCWWRCGGRGTLVHCWWESKQVKLPWKSVWRFLKKRKIKLWYDPATRRNQSQHTIEHLHPCASGSTTHNSQSRCSSKGEWIKKRWYTMECYSTIKKEQNYVLCRKMDGPRDHCVEWNKPDSERQIVCAFSHSGM
jgi:hypothetical protein